MKSYKKKSEIIDAITFQELIEYGKQNEAIIKDDAPVLFVYRGYTVSRETEFSYAIHTHNGFSRIKTNEVLVIDHEKNLVIYSEDDFNRLYELQGAPIGTVDLSEYPEFVSITNEYIIRMLEALKKTNFVNPELSCCIKVDDGRVFKLNLERVDLD